MTMLGGLFMAGWVAMASARSVQARLSENAAKRRLVLANSKVLTRQYGLTKMFQVGNTQTANATTSLGTDFWGTLDTYSGFNSIAPFDVPPVTAYPAAGYYDKVFPYNSAGGKPGPSFVNTQRAIRSSSYSGTSPYLDSAAADPFNGWLFLKSSSPAFTGDPLVIYKKPATESGEIVIDSNFNIDGRLVVRDPRSLFNFTNVDRGSKVRLLARCKSIHVQKDDPDNLVTGTNVSNTEIAANNSAATVATNGFTAAAGLTTAYDGELNVVNNSANPSNSLYHLQDREVAAGASLLTILSPLDYGAATDPVQVIQYTSANGRTPPTNVKPPGWPSGYSDWSIAYIRLSNASLPHIRISSAINQIVLEGQTTSADFTAAAAMDPRIIIVESDPAKYTKFTYLTYENSRRIIFGTKGRANQVNEMRWVGPNTPSAIAPPATVSTPLTLDWRMNLINEGRQTVVYIPTSGGYGVAIIGGVQTNWSFERGDAGAYTGFKISPVWTSDYTLARVLPREGWLETYFQITR